MEEMNHRNRETPMSDEQKQLIAKSIVQKIQAAGILRKDLKFALACLEFFRYLGYIIAFDDESLGFLAKQNPAVMPAIPPNYEEGMRVYEGFFRGMYAVRKHHQNFYITLEMHEAPLDLATISLMHTTSRRVDVVHMEIILFRDGFSEARAKAIVDALERKFRVALFQADIDKTPQGSNRSRA